MFLESVEGNHSTRKKHHNFSYSFHISIMSLHLESTIDISYTLDSASHPAGERKLKPDRSRILREAAILVVPTERDNLYILYCGNGQS